MLSTPWPYNRPATVSAKCSDSCTEEAPRRLNTVLCQDPVTRSSGAPPPVWAKRDRLLLMRVLSWGGQTTMVISHSRGVHGLLPLRVQEQAPLVALITTEGTSEEVIVTKHYLFLLQVLWELTNQATATATATATTKCSGHLMILQKAHYHSQGLETRSSLFHLPACTCCC